MSGISNLEEGDQNAWFLERSAHARLVPVGGWLRHLGHDEVDGDSGEHQQASHHLEGALKLRPI